MADLKEVQGMNAERIVSQFLAVRKELQNRGEDADLNSTAATLTAALCSSGAGAVVNGPTDGKPKYLTMPRTS